MFPPIRRHSHKIVRCPHSRGDVPTPHQPLQALHLVVPTRVGMFPRRLVNRSHEICCPHSRGDVPIPELHDAGAEVLSPLAWGCSPGRCGTPPAGRSCPHSRGDVPGLMPSTIDSYTLSPLAWGCSLSRQNADVVSPVVPTRVGMFLFSSSPVLIRLRCPHSRGDVPLGGNMGSISGKLSPLAWGCSLNAEDQSWCSAVVPTRVGMFLD